MGLDLDLRFIGFSFYIDSPFKRSINEITTGF